MDWYSKWRAVKHIRESSYRVQLADLPTGLETYWRYSAPLEYEGIRTDALFFARAAEGLMCFFDAVRRSRKPCALPSEAADSVWHAWLRWHPASLESFCRRYFGGAVPHVERDGLEAGALLNTFAVCRTLEHPALFGMHLPMLFGLDARLRMPGGHGYWTRRREVVYARLCASGTSPGHAHPHPELSRGALLAAGVTGADLLDSEWRRRQADGASCGAFADSACGDGSADSGGDAGSGCGSGCGGGCGAGGD